MTPPLRRRPVRVVALAVPALLAAGASGAGAADAPDTAAPRTTSVLAGAGLSSSGWARGPVDVRFTVTDDGGSGVARTEYRVDGGAWQAAGPSRSARVSDPGVHVVEYRSVDGAGNTESVRTAGLRIDANAPSLTTAVSHTADSATVAVTADDTRAGAGTTAVAYRVDGGAWQTVSTEQVIFDGTAAALDRWRMAGPGRFDLGPDRSMRTTGGLGLLWYPERYGDIALRLQWRDGRADGVRSNGGVFVRFPDPEAATALLPPRERHACQLSTNGMLYAEWSAVGCGHEIQVNDAASDPQKTGSVYNFKPLDSERSRPVPYGQWNDYEVRTVGGGAYAVTVVRNGEVINSFVNTPGQRAARAGDPPTDLRQFADGFVGLQNHGGADTIDYRDIRVLALAPFSSSFVVTGAGEHVVEVQAVDDAGNTSVTTTTVTVPGSPS